MNIKPVFILSRGAGVFVDQKGGLEMIVDGDVNQSRITALLDELKTEVGDQVSILDEVMVGDPSDFESLFTSKDEIHVIIAYFLGVTPIEELLRWQGPIIAFSGQHTLRT